MPGNKYHAQPCQGYHSKLEAAVGKILDFRLRAGEIDELRRQHAVSLGGRKWKCDFSYRNKRTGVTVWVEAKGFVTREWLWIKEMWKLIGPGRLEVWGGHYSRPFTTEVLEGGRNGQP